MGVNSTVKRAVFFDRDGVLIQAILRDGKPYSPAGIDDVVLNADAPVCLNSLRTKGFLLICVTNQPDVARGIIQRNTVEAVNDRLIEWLPLNAVFTCYHDDRDDCDCRKPKPGLLLRAAHQFNIDLSASFIIGDRWRDIEAGLAAGCRTIFLDYSYQERPPERSDARVKSLAEGTAWILLNDK